MNTQSSQYIQPTSPQPKQADIDVVLDFKVIFGILRRGWWLITGAAFAGAVIAAVLVLRVEPTFSAKAQLLLGQKSRPGGALAALVQDLNLDDDAITGEIAIINSARLLSKVTTKLNLETRPEFNSALREQEGEPSFLAQTMDTLTDSIKAILGGSEPAEPTVLRPQDEGAVDVSPIEAAAQVGRDSLSGQSEFVGNLRRSLRVSRVGNSNLVDVRFITTDRQLAAAVPNAVVEVYLQDQLDRKFGALQRVTAGLETRLTAIRERLEAAEQAVIDYRNRNLADGFGSQKQLDQQLVDLARRVGQASAERAEQRSELGSIDRLIRERGAVAAAGLFRSNLVDQMLSQITELRQRREVLFDQSGGETRQTEEIEIEIERLETVIQAEVQRLRDVQENRVNIAVARLEALSDQLVQLETRAIEQAERDLKLAQLERDYDAEQTVYKSFLDKFTQTSEVANLQESDAQITVYASPPASPIAPDRKLAVALGGFAGIFGGMGLVFIGALSDRSIRTASQLRKLTGGAATFTQPRVRGGVIRSANPLALALDKPSGTLSESVRSLRSHILLSTQSERNNGIVVTVTSARKGASKTTTSLLLARSLSEMGVSTVVVEADMRNPSMAKTLDIPTRPDLVDVIDGNIPIDEALMQDQGSDVRLLPSRGGTKDPAGYLLSEKMSGMIKRLRRVCRVVIIDSAPVTLVSDASPLVRMSDNVIFNVRHGTAISEVEAGLDVLRELGATQVCMLLSFSPNDTDTLEHY